MQGSSSLSDCAKMLAGGDNKIGAAVAIFKPQVTCSGTMTAPPSSCRYIMDEMLKVVSNENYGRATDPSIDVALPLTLRARKTLRNLVSNSAPISNANDFH